MVGSQTLSHSHAIRKSGVLVLNGYGIRVQINAGHLLLHDGIAGRAQDDSSAACKSWSKEASNNRDRRLHHL
jgi:hypothetical protein